ncbi:Scarecrow-like transcription factor [Quillaja saponaria]|uniref:Scarecrow-like transcription factor n=1 Tax=Quillaja saponaria TaxID=32244 RepID=A0AAD7KV68_QUISA|nr:Scarecrow-like transcription factor [Quillaja saponaria]
MQKSHKHQSSGGIHGLCQQAVQDIDPYHLSHFQILENNACQEINSSQRTSVSFGAYKEQYFTLESSPAASLIACDSPSGASVSSNRSPHSPQDSQSCLSDQHHCSENTCGCGSPISSSSCADDSNELKHKLRELEISLLGPESDIVDSCYCCFKGGYHQTASVPRGDWDKMVEMNPKLDLKVVLMNCARAVSDADIPTAVGLMDVLGRMVSVSGEPMQRLGAYLLEGLRARLESSGSSIYKSLKCKEPTSKELMTSMHILYQICPYFKFAYMSANVVIEKAMEHESRIHIIDFQIAQGSQWVSLIQALAGRHGGPPFIRIMGIDDSQSFHARGGGLDIVGKRLSQVAESCGVPFEFHGAAMSGCDVELQNLGIRPGEAVAVNFPFVLHHIPDESVSTHNHRDRLLRLVKSLSPKVVTLVEQESNTNTSPFISRFRETMDYYTAMFESIDVARPRDDKQRISAEQHCVARDIVNMIACEGAERVERHELFGKWRARFSMAGFRPYPLSLSVINATRNLLKDYHENYRLEQGDGALYLGWINRALATSSAWW